MLQRTHVARIVTAVGLAAVFAHLHVHSQSTAAADIRTEQVIYHHEGVELHGYLAYDASIQGQRPGVLVVHEWWGLNDYAKRRARELAELGYVAFAVDMYGQGRVTDDAAQAGQWAGELYGDFNRMRARAKAGLDKLAGHVRVSPGRIAAIGYCFGGTVSLQLAYAGPEALRGVVSFHGSLTPPSPEDDANLRARILVCHGAADPHVPQEQIRAFESAMARSGADCTFISYNRAVHSFTSPEADERGMDGVAYDAAADRRSWRHMKQFFDEIFSDD